MWCGKYKTHKKVQVHIWSSYFNIFNAYIMLMPICKLSIFFKLKQYNKNWRVDMRKFRVAF